MRGRRIVSDGHAALFGAGTRLKRSEIAAIRDSQSGLALARLVAHLQEEARRKNGSLTVLSHEPRSPLTPIRDSLCLSETAGVEGAQARLAREAIATQVEQMPWTVSTWGPGHATPPREGIGVPGGARVCHQPAGLDVPESMASVCQAFCHTPRPSPRQ